jgi:hypothetical protein
MDSSEKLVEVYLQSLFSKVEYEPIRNETPDFLCDNRVAVEVRRLDEGHDTDQRNLEDMFDTHLPTFGRPTSTSGSWYVSCEFSRPLGHFKVLRRELGKVLIPFRDSPNPQNFRAQITDSLLIEVIRHPGSLPNCFNPCMFSDLQQGGSDIPRFMSHMQRCIDEKNLRIQNNYAKYDEWWLALIDSRIRADDEFFACDLPEMEEFKPGNFHKIIVLDESNPCRHFQIHPRSNFTNKAEN